MAGEGGPIIGLDNMDGGGGGGHPALSPQQFGGAGGAIKSAASHAGAALKDAGAVDALGGGPEDPIGDVAAVGAGIFGAITGKSI